MNVVRDRTTELADEVLRVPRHYYRDAKITDIEEAQILRRTPLAIVPSAQLAKVNDYVVRSVLGDSLPPRSRTNWPKDFPITEGSGQSTISTSKKSRCQTRMPNFWS